MMPLRKPLVIMILGLTNSGKSQIGMKLAEQLDGEIICCDSMTVYKDINLFTSKPTTEDRNLIPHHLVDMCKVSEGLNAGEFVRTSRACISDIISRGKTPIIVGGTTLWSRVIIDGIGERPPSNPDVRKKAADILSPLLERSNQLKESSLRSRDQSTKDSLDVIWKQAIDLVKSHDHHCYGIDLSQANKLNFRHLARYLEIFLTPPVVHPKVYASPLSENYSVLPFFIQEDRLLLYDRCDRRSIKMITDGGVDEVANVLEMFKEDEIEFDVLQSIGFHESRQFLSQINKLNDIDAMVEPFTALVSGICQHTREFARKQVTFYQTRPRSLWLNNACYMHLTDRSRNGSDASVSNMPVMNAKLLRQGNKSAGSIIDAVGGIEAEAEAFTDARNRLLSSILYIVNNWSEDEFQSAISNQIGAKPISNVSTNESLRISLMSTGEVADHVLSNSNSLLAYDRIKKFWSKIVEHDGNMKSQVVKYAKECRSPWRGGLSVLEEHLMMRSFPRNCHAEIISRHLLQRNERNTDSAMRMEVKGLMSALTKIAKRVVQK